MQFSSKLLLACLVALAALLPCSSGQESGAAGKPTEHVLGTITAVDSAGKTVTVKEDKTSTEYVVSVKDTRTLLKVSPGAKDLKSATRITADDLATADRVDVRGFKSESSPTEINARSVVLMSGRELQQKHQAEASAWENSTAGIVSSVDPAANTLVVSVRKPEGTTPVTVQTASNTEFTRYSPSSPKTPSPSKLSDIQAGDQVRVIGQASAEGAGITAERVYSGAFRTIAGTVISVAPDGKQVNLKNLQSGRPIAVSLTADSTVRKLPPEMAMRLARRFNPGARPAAGGGPEGGNAAPAQPGGEPRPGMRSGGNGDLSRMLERLPPMNVSDLKAGDALVVSGALVSETANLIATTVIAGVEPIFQSAPPRQGQSLNSDWSLDMAIPAQ